MSLHYVFWQRTQYGRFLIPLAQQLCWSWCQRTYLELPSPSWQISAFLWVPEGHASRKPLHGSSCEGWWCIFWSPPCWWRTEPPSRHPSWQEPPKPRWQGGCEWSGPDPSPALSPGQLHATTPGALGVPGLGGVIFLIIVILMNVKWVLLVGVFCLFVCLKCKCGFYLSL